MKNKPERLKEPLHKKGDKIELTVSALDEDGSGLGATATSQVRVTGALPGERIIARIEHVGRHSLTASRLKLIEPSKERCKSPCAHVKDCEGCPLIEMKYEAQLAWKENIVTNHIKQHKSLENTKILPVIPSPRKLAYRNSAKLVIGGKYADPVIGIYRRESHDIQDISNCPLHNPLINRIIAVVKKGIIKGKIPIYSPRSAQGLLRYLLIRVAEAENKAMVTIVTAKRSYNELHHLASLIRKEIPEVTVIAQNVNSSSGNVILGSRNFFHTRQTSLEATVGGLRFLVSPHSFFQINSGSAELIYNLVRDFSSLTGKENVLDLYCGVGSISLFLASSAKSVFGIESVEDAVEDARLNARTNRVFNCDFEAGDVVDEMKHIITGGTGIDVTVLNPPRKGCEERVLRQVASLDTPRIIYVSCSPSSLSRDLAILDTLGYKCEKIQPVDMFPQTTHIESVALLYRR
ncbi:MAG TPA: 23S rRNA (uracil(1939)-C(5))-methyltransferase RlmD [Geobacteraceae bacterium]|nr:23S rRNA (uracil(1939)-C(5))-methyltransferase RlmD [Geobacteraceae bacterium]